MNNMNQVIIEGNLVKAPEFKQFSETSHLCSFPIAVNRIIKDKDGNDAEEVAYFDIEAWGEKLNEIVKKCGFKGRGIRVVGRLKQNRWKSPDGKSNSKISIVAEHVDFKFMKKKDAVVQDNTTPSDLESAAQGIQHEVAEAAVF